LALNPDAPVILVGGHSRAAAAIRAAMPGARIFSIARGEGGADAITSDYTSVPAGVPFAGAIVVNCVGTDRGERPLLDHVNRAVPIAWATAAREGGARQFIQLSSFSVYAPTRIVRQDSVLGPSTDYGRSKLAAEEGLAVLATDDFAIALLRVPILVASDPAGATDKLAALLSLVRKARVVPQVNPPVRRAMLTYQGLGAATALLAERRAAGVFAAADPEPFTYELVAECAARAGRSVLRVPIPKVAVGLLGSFAPALSQRLFESMELAPETNLLTQESYSGVLREAIVNQLG
jgi:nucleoside-diphosphate-sugar epimerase